MYSRFPGEHPDRHAARQHFSVGGQIGANSKQRLAAALVHAEAGDHFVEDQRGTGIFGDRANFFQERDRLQVRMAALHRLDQHRGQFFGVGANPFQRLRRAVIEHGDVSHFFLRNSGRHRGRLRQARFLMALHQHFIGLSVIGAGE